MEEMILTPKHTDLVHRLQNLFPEATIMIEDEVPYYNRGGFIYAKAHGVAYQRVTSSYEEGPEYDYSEEIKQILLNSGFELAHYYTTGCDERNYENYEYFYFGEKESKVEFY